MRLLEFQCEHQYPGGFRFALGFTLCRRFTALFGPSGCGKTSILSVIAGFLRPQQGRVMVGGRTLLETGRGVCLRPERRRVGFVFQDGLLFPHLTVEGNLRYGQRHRRSARVVDFQRVIDVLEIGHLLRRKPRHLSGGERQRVALGRALLSGPELLLMDEPLAALDAPLKMRILDYLQRAVAEWNVPTLFVTHEQTMVRRAAEWVVVVREGRLVATGPPDEALGRPETLAWANAAGPVNLLRVGELESADGQTVARVGTQRLVIPPQAAAGPIRFVQFAPADVILSRHDVSGLSARNHLHGRVERIVDLGQAVFVAVDVGQVLWAEVTPQAAAELELHPGCEVTCLLKVHRLSVIE